MVLGFSCVLLALPREGTAREATNDHAQRARVAYDLRDWTTAAREFTAAYEAEPKSEFLFGLAQSLRQAHDYAGAIFTFRAYKRTEGLTPQQATAAELLMTQCEAEQAKLEAQAAMQQANSGAPRPVTPSGPPEPAPAGAVAAEPDVSTQRPAPATPAPSASATPVDRSPPSPFYADVLGDTLFVTGLAAAGVGTGLLLSGNGAMADSARAPTEGQASQAADDAHSRQVLGSVLCPVGGALLVGAVWRWLAVSSPDEPVVDIVSVGPRSIQFSGQF